MIKLVLLDVDGTLTGRDRRISTRAVEAIRNSQKQGTVVCLASGNVIPVMYGLRIFLGLNGPVFGENGGVMYQERVESFFTMEKPLKLFRELEIEGLLEGILSNKWRECSMAYVPAENQENEISARAASDGLFTVDSGFSWHLLNSGQNKGFALEHLKKMYSLRYEEMLVMGDSFNDMSMFRKEVFKAVPMNAEERLKEVADYTAKSSNGDGVAEVLSDLSRF